MKVFGFSGRSTGHWTVEYWSIIWNKCLRHHRPQCNKRAEHYYSTGSFVDIRTWYWEAGRQAASAAQTGMAWRRRWMAVVAMLAPLVCKWMPLDPIFVVHNLHNHFFNHYFLTIFKKCYLPNLSIHCHVWPCSDISYKQASFLMSANIEMDRSIFWSYIYNKAALDPYG